MLDEQCVLNSAIRDLVPRVCLQRVIVVFPDHTHVLFLNNYTFNTCI